MKRRQRKPVLDINGENAAADSPRRRWPSERQLQNGSPSNPLQNLVGDYNSDSETEDDKPRARVLNDQVNHFFKEIQSIAHEDPKASQNSAMPHPGSFWQECYDEQTGYPYYWHTETNQVTWEMPPELKILQEKGLKEPSASHSGAQFSPWSNMPPNKYPQTQSNIPDGMIPKEVVVRNRNRQAGIVNTPEKPLKSENIKSPGHKKTEREDDGKIEMITSFGNDESESEESEHEEPIKKPSCLKKPNKSEKSSISLRNSEFKETRPQIGPAPPPLHYGPENKEKLSDKLSKNIYDSKASPEHKIEADILTRLKNQAKLMQYRGNDHSPNSYERDDRSHTPPMTSLTSITTTTTSTTTVDSLHKSSRGLKLSLVPGYEDESDAEDESHGQRSRSSTIKPLFPITEQSAMENAAKKLELKTGSVRVYDYRNVENSPAESRSVDDDASDGQNNIEEKPVESVDLEAKANKFLESIDPPSKAFQRKKRIAFDVALTKSKDQESKDEPSSNSPLQSNTSSDPTERRGLGFSKDEDRGSPEVEGSSSSKSEPEAKKLSNIAFVKSTEESNSSNGSSSSSSNTSKPKEISEAEKAELRQLTEPIMEKLKFLSEGSPAASAVQVMAIQIQTLLCAWEAGVLQETYLRNWLVGTGCELSRLEQTAAPPGWECQWDRSHKRYYYRNASTGEAQWTYPQTDIVGGTEEMELCTTPPPPEHEEAPIIEMSAQDATMSTSKHQDNKQQSQPSDSTPQPPPQISSPSPPPPPRIHAEDIKRSRKRRNSLDNSEHKDEEEPKESKPRGHEPLPPGVDPPELTYALPASALEAGVLYGAQQTNPIYAATLAGAAAAAGIPLLSHHPHHAHTALMQGQLVHYNPAYHQHLHNQALVAARLSGQEAVQFMVAAEYARVYENNQVIAKPPVKVTQEASLGSALNSFYSDIATIEKTAADAAEKERVEAVMSPAPQVPTLDTDAAALDVKKEKKKKIKTGIGKKQKEMSSMVAKWQRAQKNYKD